MSDTTQSLRQKSAARAISNRVVRTMKALAASSIGQYEELVRALKDYYRAVELGLGACFRESGTKTRLGEAKGANPCGYHKCSGLWVRPRPGWAV